jgi:4'-phosphopantetheinyl transferase
LPPETAEVWWAGRGDFRDALTGLFDEVERARFAGYRRDEDKERFAVGCALAKRVVARYAGGEAASVTLNRACSECGGQHGKPAAVGTDLELSVSHSGDAVVVAVTAGAPCGVDVERLDRRRDSDALGRYVLAESERAAARTDGGLLRAWTRKEAVTKATGDGLRTPFTQVIVSGADEPPRVLAWPYPEPPQAVSLFDLDAPPGYLAAVAVLGPCHDIFLRNGRDLLA